MLDALWMDVHDSLRRLRRSAGASLVVVATLALAIGANATVFSLLNATLLRTVSAPEPDRLVTISAIDGRTNVPSYIYRDALAAFSVQQKSFSALSMYSGGGAFRVQTGSVAFDGGYEGVTPEYFGIVGARLSAGRFLTEADNDVSDAMAPAVVITNRLWQRAFGGDPQAIGSTMKVDGRTMTIVGATAPGFDGLQFDLGADLFVPIALARSNAGTVKRQIRAANAVGRLAPGATLTQARAELLALWPGIQAATMSTLSAAEQSTVQSQRMSVQSLAGGYSVLRREYGTSLVVLVGLAAVLLAIGWVNLAGLMLARALTQQNEIAVRLALGARRMRLVRQAFIDGLLLAVGGLAAALPLAWTASQMLTSILMVGSVDPLLRPMTPDGRVVMAAAVVAIVTALLIGIIPAWRTANGSLFSPLRGRGVARTPGRSGRLILVTQVALSMVLVVGAGLFAGTLSNLYANDAHGRRQPVVFTRLSPDPGQRGPALGQPYFQGLLEQLAQIPGVDRAAYSAYFPAYLGFAGTLPTDSYASDEVQAVAALTEFVSPGFFDLFGIAHLRGREFDWTDNAQAPQAAILNESLATKLFPSGDAIGHLIRVTSGPSPKEAVIVGVVADAPIGQIRDPHQAVLFRPLMQDLARAQFAMAHVRVSGDVKAVREAYVRTVESQGRHYVRGLLTLEEWIDNAVVRERLVAGMTTSAATLAVVLACVGIYGLLAYTVTSRVREIGVRMSLGATRATVVGMILREALTIVVPGAVIGIPCALGAAMLVRSQLYGVSPVDPPTAIGSAVVFLLTGVVAAGVPALRAAKIEPAVALRAE